MANISLLLKNIRIRGLGNVIETDWIKLDDNLTYFSLPSNFNRNGILQALQTINPPYECGERKPFNDYPLITRQGKYQKRVRPHKRTIAFAIFIAQPGLVMELGKITPHLYEADRIEVGRRLDYSRWLNFIEIASSTRWSEVQSRVLELAKKYPDFTPTAVCKLITSLNTSDRVNNEVLELLDSWLRRLAKGTEFTNQGMIDELLFDINRQSHFISAIKHVKQCLPQFFIIDKKLIDTQTSTNSPRVTFEVIEKLINTLLLLEKNEQGMPVLLFDAPELALPAEMRGGLQNLVQDTSQKCQCLYFAGEENSRNELFEGNRIVTFSDMRSKPHNK